MISKLRRIYRGPELAPSAEEPGCSTDLPSLEKGSNAEKRRAETLLSRLQQLLLFLVVFLICPVVIYSGFKFFILQPLYPGDPDNNVAIGSAVATVVVMHVLITGYILRVIFAQEFSRLDQLDVFTERETLVPTQHGPVLIVLLLMSYCALIVAFPIATFFALKFVVLKSFAHLNADIISAICTVVAVHGAVGFYIYRAIYSKTTTATAKNQ